MTRRTMALVALLSAFLVAEIYGGLNTWETLTSNPPGFRENGAFVYSGALYRLRERVVVDYEDDENLMDVVYKLEDLDQFKWEIVHTGGEIPPLRSGFCVESVGDKAYLFGGFVNGYTSELYELDLKTWSWKFIRPDGSIPPARTETYCFQHGGRFYIQGGSASVTSLADMWSFDAAGNKWDRIPYNSGSTTYYTKGSYTTYLNFFIKFGGSFNSDYNPRLEVFNLETYAWSSVIFDGSTGTSIPGSELHAAGLVGSKFYLLYGANANFLSSMYIIDLENTPLSYSAEKVDYGPQLGSYPYGSTPPMLKYRGQFRNVKDKLVLTGGYRSCYDDTVWIFDPATDSWTSSIMHYPMGRTEASVTKISETEFAIFGGFASCTTQTPLTDLWTFNIETKRWTLLFGLNDEAGGEIALVDLMRQNPTIWFDEKSVHVVGGGYSEESVAPNLKFNIETKQWSVFQLPVDLEYLSAMAGVGHLFEEGKHYFFGGSPYLVDYSDLTILQSVIWNINNGQVIIPEESEEIVSLVGVRLFLRMGDLHIAGGQVDEETYDTSIWRCRNDRTWEQVSEDNPEIPGLGASFDFVGQLMMVGGGYAPDEIFNDIYFYNFDSETWNWHSTASKRPPAIFKHATLRMQDKLVLVTGSTEFYRESRVFSYSIGEAFCTSGTQLSLDGAPGELDDGSGVMGYLPFSKCTWLIAGAKSFMVDAIDLAQGSELTIQSTASCGDVDLYDENQVPVNKVVINSSNVNKWFTVPEGEWMISFTSSSELISAGGYKLLYIDCPSGFSIRNHTCYCPNNNYITISGECYPCATGFQQPSEDQHFCTPVSAVPTQSMPVKFTKATVTTISAPMPTCKYSKMVNEANRFYLFCLFENADASSSSVPVEVYEIEVTAFISWRQMKVAGAKPYSRKGACVVHRSNMIYYIGGYSAAADTSVYSFDLNSSTWTMITTKQATKEAVNYAGHSCAILGDLVYMHGGESVEGETLDRLVSFDLRSNSWQTVSWENSPAISHHISWSYSGKIYLFGGFDGVQELSQYFEGNPVSRKWSDAQEIHLDECISCKRTAGATCNIPRQMMGYTIAGDMIYIFGGLSSHLALRDVIGIDMKTTSVTDQRSFDDGEILPLRAAPPLIFASVALEGSKMVVYGGTGEEDGVFENGIHAYDLEKKTWILSSAAEEILPRENHAITNIDQRTVIVFGGRVLVGNKYLTNDMWIYYMETRKWIKVCPYQVAGNGPSPRANAALVYHNGFAYVFGGEFEDDGQLEKLWRVNVSSVNANSKVELVWESVEITKEIDPNKHHIFERKSFSYVLKGSSVWIWSGQVVIDTGSVEDYRSVFELNLQSRVLKTYTQLGGPIPRILHTTMPSSRGFIIHGGRDFRNRPLSDVWEFILGSNTWSRLDDASAELKTFLSQSRGFQTGDYIFLVGGLNQADNHQSTISAFQISTKKWGVFPVAPGSEPLNAIAGHAGTTLDDGVFVFGGSTPLGLESVGFTYRPGLCNPEKVTLIDSTRTPNYFTDPSGVLDIPGGTDCRWQFNGATHINITFDLGSRGSLQLCPFDGKSSCNSPIDITESGKVLHSTDGGFSITASVGGVFGQASGAKFVSISHVDCPQGASFAGESGCECPDGFYEDKSAGVCASCENIDGQFGCPVKPVEKNPDDVTALAAAVGGGVGGFLLLVGLIGYKRYRDHAKELAEKENALFMHVSYDELEFGKLLGVGSFGEVYIGKWRETDVAIKRLNAKVVTKEVVKGFEDEVAVMVQLRHPNVVLYMAACVEPGKLCIISELMSRGSLHGILHNESLEIEFQMRVRFLLDAAKGLQYLHMSTPPILHRDLKSPNLLLDEKWNCKISDFGLTGVRGKTSATNEPPGTLLWMAPEVVAGKEYTEKSDIFSFAVIMWEVFSRLEPYEGEIAESVAIRVLRENLRPKELSASEMPPELQHVMMEAWSQDAEARPSFTSIVKQLARFNEEKTSSLSSFAGTMTAKSSTKEDAPTGKIVIIFTAVENSALIWEKAPDHMNNALLIHNEIMRGVLKRNHGYEVKTEGDAFMVSFRSVQDAVLFCHQAQEMLLAADWPAEILKLPAAQVETMEGREVFSGLRVRMGMHVGEPICQEDPVSGRMDYFGPVVNRAARVASVPKGGQVIMSQAAYEEIKATMNTVGNPVVRDLGSFELKGLASAEVLFEILPQSLALRASFFGSDAANTLNIPSSDDGTNQTNNGFAWQMPFEDIEISTTELGAGSFGTVYLGKYGGQEVAVKRFLKQKMAERQYFGLLSEIMLMRSLDHPYILKFVGACVKQPNICFVMEYAKYGSLRVILSDTRTEFSDSMKRSVLAQVADGMRYLHARQPPVVHRDLKSPNVLVVSLDPIVVKICDFGLARVKSDNQTMTKCGTRAWLAPEVLRGSKYTEKVDVYSFSILIWEVLTRDRPYEGMDALKLSMEVVNGLRPVVPKNGDKDLISLMKRCWTGDETKRPSFEEITAELPLS